MCVLQSVLWIILHCILSCYTPQEVVKVLSENIRLSFLSAKKLSEPRRQGIEQLNVVHYSQCLLRPAFVFSQDGQAGKYQVL